MSPGLDVIILITSQCYKAKILDLFLYKVQCVTKQKKMVQLLSKVIWIPIAMQILLFILH